MRTDYSKPSGDIAPESDDFIVRDAEMLARQKRMVDHLLRQPERQGCVLCDAVLAGADGFEHRGTPYVRCPSCGQVQTRARPPQGYPHAIDGNGFEAVYPKLERAAYLSRRDRIYTPKRDWIQSCLEDAGWGRDQIVGSRWMEIGCGAGYFLSALREAGVAQVSGVDENPDLVALANDHLGQDLARVADMPLAEIVTQAHADIIAAFFVFEHLEDARDVWGALAQKPSGSVFAFSVPVFSFATLLESAFTDFGARNLDSVVHTQLYTDESIAYALNASGYRVVGEWIFGQDAIDLRRVLMKRLVPVYPGHLVRDVEERLGQVLDDLQGVLDRARLADARHVVAIKE